MSWNNNDNNEYANNEYAVAMKNFAKQAEKVASYVTVNSLQDGLDVQILSMSSNQLMTKFSSMKNQVLMAKVPPAEIAKLLKNFMKVCKSVSDDEDKKIFIQTEKLLLDSLNKKINGQEALEQAIKNFEQKLPAKNSKVKVIIAAARESISIVQENAKPSFQEQICAYTGGVIGGLVGLSLGPLALTAAAIVGLFACGRYMASMPSHDRPSTSAIALGGALGYTIAMPVLSKIAALGFGLLGVVGGGIVSTQHYRKKRSDKILAACATMQQVLDRELPPPEKIIDQNQNTAGGLSGIITTAINYVMNTKPSVDQNNIDEPTPLKRKSSRKKSNT